MPCEASAFVRSGENSPHGRSSSADFSRRAISAASAVAFWCAAA